MSSNQVITIDNLPSEITIDIPEETNNLLLSILMYAGIGIAVVGFLFIIFGPDKIYYNAGEGMTFIQMLQAYPGPIASVGGVLFFAGSQISNYMGQKNENIINDQLDAQINIQDSDIPEGFVLNMKPLEEGKFLVELVESKNEDDEKKNKL
ncbi:MAG: hypothetical protein GY714_01065 [Desulfobacterales bacterium]|nr:hypothetical protein [Desulfobacterales bacterium]